MALETKWVALIGDKLNYFDWTAGIGSSGNFSSIGASGESSRELGNDPWGKEILLWKCDPSGDGNADGGWNVNYIPVDINKLYRFSCWYYRTGTSNGNSYLGNRGWDSTPTNIGVYRVSDDVLNTNQYWWSGDPPSYDEWILVVGFIFPHDYTDGVNHPDNGKYTIADGYVTSNGSDCYWHPNTVSTTHRAYFYYVDTDYDTNYQWMCYPRIDLVDGTEPSIEELLNGLDSRNFDYLDALDGDYSNIGLDKYGIWHTHSFSEIGPYYGLTNYWKLNGELRDWAGGQHGTAYNSPTVVQGILGDAYYFDGTNQYIDLGTSTDFNPAEVSISMVTYIDPADDTTDDWAMFVQLGVSSGVHLRWRYVLDRFEGMTTWTTAGNKYNYSGDITVAGWYHVVITADTSGYSAMYVNGSLVDDDNQADDVITYGDTQGYIGGNGTSNSNKCTIDEVRVYDRALTQAEVSQLYNIYINETPMQFDSVGRTMLRGQLITI